MPEKESDPPQFKPSEIFDAGRATRFSAAARSIILSMDCGALLPPWLAASDSLQRHAHQAIRPRRSRAQIMIDLIHFAAQAENHRRRNVRMIQHAGQRAPQLRQVRPRRLSAAVAMRKRDHSVDAFGQRSLVVTGRDPFRRMRRAIAGRDHRNIVARPGASVLARISHERRNIRGRGRQRNIARRKFVIEM